MRIIIYLLGRPKSTSSEASEDSAIKTFAREYLTRHHDQSSSFFANDNGLDWPFIPFPDNYSL